MISAFGLGFLFIIILSHWVAAGVADRRASTFLGLFTGLLVAVLLLGVYGFVLVNSFSAELVEFAKGQLPDLIARAVEFVQEFQAKRGLN